MASFLAPDNKLKWFVKSPLIRASMTFSMKAFLIKTYSHDFTQLPPGQCSCSHRNYFNSLGSEYTGQQAVTRQSEFLHCPTRYPFKLQAGATGGKPLGLKEFHPSGCYI